MARLSRVDGHHQKAHEVRQQGVPDMKQQAVNMGLKGLNKHDTPPTKWARWSFDSGRNLGGSFKMKQDRMMVIKERNMTALTNLVVIIAFWGKKNVLMMKSTHKNE